MNIHRNIGSKPASVRAMRAAFEVIQERIAVSEFSENVRNYLQLCFNNFVFDKEQDMFGYLKSADMTFDAFCRKVRQVPQRAFTQQGQVDVKMQEELGVFLQQTVDDALEAARKAMQPERGRA